MKILHLTLKKKWFDMLLSGEKPDEYREMKPYWIKRLRDRHYDAVSCTNGYGKHRPNFVRKLNFIDSGIGRTEWGAPENKKVFILSFGKILDTNNIEAIK